MEADKRQRELENIRNSARKLGYPTIGLLNDAQLEKIVLQVSEMIAKSGLSGEQILTAIREFLQTKQVQANDQLADTIQAMRDFIDTRKMKVLRKEMSDREHSSAGDE